MGQQFGEPFSEHMSAVAHDVLGEPVTKNNREFRYGSQGSLSIDIHRGVFQNFENEEQRGGVLDFLVAFEDGVENHADAVRWLRKKGYPIPDRADYEPGKPRQERPQPSKPKPASKATAKPKPANADKADQAEIIGKGGEWNYTDEEGEVLFKVVRYELSNGKKTFGQYGADGAGGFRRGPEAMHGVRLVPYMLAEVLEAVESRKTIYLVEGEKKADRLRREGLCATCNPMGAGKWGADTDEGRAMAAALNQYFRGAHVVILPDNDEPGRRHARYISRELYEIADSCVVVTIPNLKEKDDVYDWFEEYGGTVAGLESLITSEAVPAEEYAAEPLDQIAQADDTPPTVFLDLIDPTTLDSKTVPAREWHAEPLIPHRTVTLLSGDGGTGKSLLALQLAVSTAIGSPWIGREVAAGRALYVSAEDDMNEVHRRLSDICEAEGARLRDLASLRIASLAGEDAVLAAPMGKAGLIQGTPLWAALVARCEAFRPRLLVLDTSADLYAGEENNRAQVRQFIGMLRGLAIRLHMTVVLLSHPSLTGMASGSGSSGSTAWNNSVRSRLYFRRATAPDGDEPDPDLRILETKKANYGTTGGELALRWQAGRFVAEKGSSASAFDRVAAEARTDSLFLELLRSFADQGRHVSSKTGPSYAPFLFSKDPRASGTSKRALEAAMQRLFVAGRLKLETFGSPSRQLTRLVLCEPKARED